MLTKKDYKAIAEIIKDANNTAYDMIAATEFINAIADYAEQGNPRFDRQRFLATCGIKPE